MKGAKWDSSIILIIICYIAFVSLGLPDGLLGIAWPSLSRKYNVPIDSLGILLIVFVAGYLLTSIFNGKILARIHLGLLLAVSCLVTGLSLLGYAFSGYWYLIVVSSFFLGSGGGAIDSSINTFAASRFSASVVNWLHAFYGVGATAGPLIVTWLFSQGREWDDGYITVGIVQIVLSVVFLFTLRYWKVSSAQVEHMPAPDFKDTLKKPVVWLSMFTFFMYVGLEVGVGQWIFTILTKSRQLSEEEAGLWTSAYWGSLTAGRIISGFILVKFPVHKALAVALTGIVAGTLLLVADYSDFTTLSGIMCIGLCNAPMFPSLIAMTPERVGEKHTANVVGFQVSAAMTGGALLPGFAGIMTDIAGLEVIAKLFVAEAVLLGILYMLATKVKIKH